MHKLLILILLLMSMAIGTSAQEVPVLLMLKSSEQVDTSGCNFVQQVASLVYDEIMANRIKIWDSQRKDIQLTSSTIRSIEKSSGVSFKDQETVFFYEIWNNTRKEITTRTIGISFVQKSNTSEEVSFGYVDYSDLNELFMKTRVNTNASGLYSATFTTYMLSKYFAYNIVQFGGKPIRSSGESEDIRKAFLGDLRFNETLLGFYPPDKFVSYIIDDLTQGTDDKIANSKLLIKKVHEYLLQNQEVFFNMGGDRIVSHIQKNRFKVTRIEVNEIWRKVEGNITYDPRSVVIYVNDSALNELNSRTLSGFEVTINDQTLVEFLKNKQFNLIINKINSQNIPRKDSYLYHRALLVAEWNKVIRYAVNY